MSIRRFLSKLPGGSQQSCWRNAAVRNSLSYDRCESRILLAGNLTATMVGTTLKIVGDTADNVLFITKPNATTVTLSGQLTNVNASALPVSFSNVTDLNVNLGFGADTLVVSRSLSSALDFYNAPDLIQYGLATPIDAGPAMFGSVSIELGGYNDKVCLQVSTAGNVSVTDTWGNDIVALIGSTVRGAYTVESSGGHDFVLMENSRVVSTVTYELGTGNDHSHSERVQVGAWSANLGYGNNTIEFVGVNLTSGANSWRPLTVNGSVSRDTVTLNHVRFQSIDINLAGGGNAFNGSVVQTVGNFNYQGPASVLLDTLGDFDRTQIGGSLTIDNGGGPVSIGDPNRTAIRTFVKGAITINSGGITSLYGVQTSTTLEINSSAGGDLLVLQRVTALTEVIVNLGAGNDSLTMRIIRTPKATLRGGADQDVLHLLGSNWITVLDEAEFEL